MENEPLPMNIQLVKHLQANLSAFVNLTMYELDYMKQMKIQKKMANIFNKIYRNFEDILVIMREIRIELPKMLGYEEVAL